MIIFDIETTPKEDAALKKLMPYSPGEVKDLGKFDESSVKLGPAPRMIEKLRKQIHEARKKAGPDPDEKTASKITDMMNDLEERCRAKKEKIDAARKEHEDAAKTVMNKELGAEAEHYTKVKSEAALSPVLGRILVIGYYNTISESFMYDDGTREGAEHLDPLRNPRQRRQSSESAILKRFWGIYASCKSNQVTMAGVNIFDFDLPFIVNRSWVYKIKTPADVIKNDRYWNPIFVDLRRRWLCGRFGSGITVKSSFDWLSKAFKTSSKPQGVTGADFAGLWKTDRNKAVEYLRGDVEIPATWAEAMGVV